MNQTTKNVPLHIDVANLPLEARAKHCAAAAAPTYDPFRAIRRKVVLGVSALALSGLILCPGSAFAAEWINVDGTQYNTVGSSGAGWIWQTQNDLNLDGYNGTGISAKGDLNINVNNKNTVDATKATADEDKKTGVSVQDGNLTIAGDGELNVKAQEKAIVAESDGTQGGYVTIDGTTVNAEATGSGSGSGGSTHGINARDTSENVGPTVRIENGATVNVKSGNAENPVDWAWGISGTNFSVIKSTVNIDTIGKTTSTGIFASNIGKSSSVLFFDSSVTVNSKITDKGEAHGILASAYHGSGTAWVHISNSKVKLNADAPRIEGLYGDGTAGGGYGIYVSSSSMNPYDGKDLFILNSNVYAKGLCAAILVQNDVTLVPDAGDGSDIPQAKIEILGDSSIKVPANGAVRDFTFTDTYGDYTNYIRGQVIGTAGEGILGDPVKDKTAATEAQILREGVEPSDDPWGDKGDGGKSDGASKATDTDTSLVRKAYADEAGTAVAATPKTGDNEMGLFAACAAAIAGVGAAFGSLFSRKRGKHARH